MVLLPKPPPPKDSDNEIKGNTFFENDAMDHMAKHFVGNNFRFVIAFSDNNRIFLLIETCKHNLNSNLKKVISCYPIMFSGSEKMS